MISRRGQSILEYTLIVGVVTMVLFYLGTAVKRGVQSLVKVTADQVGNEQNADQDFTDTQQGYMVESNSQMQMNKNKEMTETGYVPAVGGPAYYSKTAYNETTDTQVNTITNGGFNPST